MAVLSGCTIQNYDLKPCVDAATIERLYGSLIDSMFAGAVGTMYVFPAEIYEARWAQRVLTPEARAQAMVTGHLPNDQKRAQFAPEFEVGGQERVLLEFERWPKNDSLHVGSYFQSGPHSRTGEKIAFWRGWREDGSVRMQLLLLQSYRRIDAQVFEEVELWVSYPRLLQKLGCQ